MVSIQIWGNITWFLLHGLIEKIKETNYEDSKDILIKIIISICNNLPCPDCRDHANLFFKKYNINRCNSKELLKNYLFEMHNDVNRRTKKEIFDKKDLDIKYSKINIVNVLNHFFNTYNSHSNVGAPRMMMYSSMKNVFLKDLKNDIKKIYIYLDNI